MADEQQEMLNVYLQEYDKLKNEQTQRIGFRDNLLYVTLSVFGGVLAFALDDKVNPYALLVLPWVSLVLGWTYLANDEKISAIGRYIRYTLVEKVSNLACRAGADIGEIESIFGWEIAHRSDSRRKRRKIEQLIMDEIAFVVSGIVALIAFSYMVRQVEWVVQILYWSELILLLILGWEIFVYADLAKRR
jgi:Ca2+/Na+ antiporter